MDSETADGPPRAVLIAAAAVAVGAVVALLIVVAVMQREPAQKPVAVSGIPAPQADSPQCRSLVEALPEQLGDYRRAQLVEPAPQGAAAWQPEAPDGEALILRCGLDRPAEFVTGAPLQVVDAVSWFRVGEAGAGDDRVGDGDRSTWFAVDRPVYVALTLPRDSGPTAIQTLSTIIAETLPAQTPQPAPLG
ncbi:DUF3515 domain-containing protein [Mycolicibacterium gilvum]|uniref:Protein of uncharacterized function (DUF3515) n=1 Tax=Mycolicibacterium gilvum TaxID=1804 RepID=A0A378SLN5_9MYCO|nr:DUF3515 domain-containing protein [Mycolicibacterium gilvum]MCV7054231.1 DUF3515 domain-containing protein [Mycolicibacterium gilvum]STZ42816.1 Protein of uncharacterised function (DUF3515) [Mycolicibacterium gilvum]